MLKSSLFTKLYEGGGSNKPNRNEINAINQLDKEKAEGGPRKEPKPVKVKQGRMVKDLDKEYIDQKAVYGNLYSLDKSALDSMMDELSGRPFTFGGPAVNNLLIQLKPILFSASNPQVINAITTQKNPALTELGSVLGFNGPITLDTTTDIAAQLQDVPKYVISSTLPEVDPNAYAAIVGLVFPFVDPAVLNRALDEFESISVTLQKYADAYSGSLVKPINWIAGETPDFSTFQQIADPNVSAFLLALKTNLSPTDTESALPVPPRLVKRVLVASKDVSVAFSKSVTANIASQKHINNITTNIYYSLLTRALPFNADLFEVDPNELKKVFDNPNAANPRRILTEKADTLIAARIIAVEKNPFLYKGLLGHNTRVQLAFDYAKRVSFKKAKDKSITDKTTDKVATLFEDILTNVPGMSAHFDKLSAILDAYFHPPEMETSVPEGDSTVPVEAPKAVSEAVEPTEEPTQPNNAAKLKQELDAFVKEGMSILESALSTEQLLAVYNKIVVSHPEIKEKDQTQIVNTYLQPFRDAIIARLAIIESITQPDIEAIFNIGHALTDFLSDAITKKKAKEYLQGFESYDKTRAASGDDEGYKFLRLVSNVQTLILEAKKKIKKTKNTTEEKEPKAKVNRSAAQYKGIRDARKKILATKSLLETLPVKVRKMLIDIKNELNNSLHASSLAGLVSGSANEQEQEEINAFIKNTVTKLYNTYFVGPENNFELLALEDLDAATIQQYVIADLTDKAAKGYLIASGSLKSYVDYYEGLSQDLVDFINLAASLKMSEDAQPVEVDANGNITFNYELEAVSPSESFFTKIFFGELTSAVSAEPAVSLAAQRIILARLQEPLIKVFSNMSLEQFLTPEIVKEQPQLAQKLGQYLTDLQKTASTGISSAISAIDNDILDIKGGQIVPIHSKGQMLSVSLPDTLGDEFTKNVNFIGKNALDLLWSASTSSKVDDGKHHNLKLNTTQDFFRQLIIVDNAGTMFLEEIFDHALSIVSSAINVDIARQTFYGDNTQIAAVMGMVRKYQRENNVEMVNSIEAAKAKAAQMTSAFRFSTAKKIKEADGTQIAKPGSGAQGTSVLSGKDNHIDNQLLIRVLHKFNEVITTDSWAAMALKYAESEAKARAEGTYSISDYNIIVKKIGIAFTRIGEAVAVQGPAEAIGAPVTEATDPKATGDAAADKMEQMLAQQQTGNAPIQAGKRGASANTRVLKAIVKDMEKRIYGFETTNLNKGQRHGQQVKLVTSYRDMFVKSKRSMDRATDILGSFFASTGDKAGAVELVKTVETVENNFAVLDEFFSIISGGHVHQDKETLEKNMLAGDMSGNYIANVPTQKRLMETLQKLQPVTLSQTFEDVFINTPSPNTPQFANKLTAAFSRTPGLSALYELLKTGQTFEQIKQEVTRILVGVNAADPAAKAEFLSYADLRDLDPAEEFGSTVKPAAAAQTTSKLTKFLTYITTKPLSTHEINSGEYISRLATLLDPASYIGATPEESKKLKLEAQKLLAANKNPGLPAYLQAQLAKGIVNKISGAPIKSLLDVNSLYESKLAMALALLEEEMSEQPVDPEAEGEATPRELTPAEKNAQSLNEEPYKVIAAVLAKRGIVVGKDNSLVFAQTGKPYLWNDWNPAYWILFKADSELASHASIAHRIFNNHDTMEFFLGNGRYEHAEMLKFSEIKQLVDTYYRPEELNAESTNESTPGQA
jgi:hypothetical protein